MKKIDLQDVLLVLGVASLVGGIAAWSKPAACITFGILCLALVFQIERAKRIRKGVNDGSAVK